MECAICLEEGRLILFNHNNKCGNINVHDSCLTDWFLNNDNECMICRENLVAEYELLSSDSDSESSPRNIVIITLSDQLIICIKYITIGIIICLVIYLIYLIYSFS
jgi:hypothetical protein